MNSEQARALVGEMFPLTFDKGRFRTFVINLLNHIDESRARVWKASAIKDAFRDHVQSYERLGTYTSPENDKLDVLIVALTTDATLGRARTAIRNFVADHLKTHDSKEAALVAFVSPSEKQWRLSYVKMEYSAVKTEDGKVGVETRLTPARRSSYIVGEGESCHTAQSRFLDLLQDTQNHPSLAQIEDAFSVEAVTKEFFEQYKALFLDLNQHPHQQGVGGHHHVGEAVTKLICEDGGLPCETRQIGDRRHDRHGHIGLTRAGRDEQVAQGLDREHTERCHVPREGLER